MLSPAKPAREPWDPAATWRPRSSPSWLKRVLWLWQEKGTRYLFKRLIRRLKGPYHYDPQWIRAYDALSAEDVAAIRARIAQFSRTPVISIVMAVRGAEASRVEAAIKSVREQFYERWELCIGCGSGKAAEVRALLDAVRAQDARIKVTLFEGGDDVAISNEMLATVTGEFVTFLPESGILAPHALYMIAEEVNAVPGVNLVYTDEDNIERDGRRSNPNFKPDWNPDLFLSQAYLRHLTVFRRDLVSQLGFRPGFEGSEEYDLALRVIERIPPESIRHLPWVLYHSQVRAEPNGFGHDNSHAVESARRAVQQHLDRCGISATVSPSRSGLYHRVRRQLPPRLPSVSLIIPTRDQLELLKQTVESIFERTDYPNYEVVIVDNQSREPRTHAYLSKLAEDRRVRVLRYDQSFNYSAINNFAARQCTSAILGFLNNDVAAINADWLGEMVSQVLRPEVGVVGALLYYPDGTIQHAGILVGVGGAAANAFAGLAPADRGYNARAELIQNCSAVTGACLVTRAEVFAEVSGFNEIDLPIAYNDVDYALRVREKGYLVTWTPYAELYHFESASRGDDMAPDKVKRFRREQQYLVERWGDVVTNDPYYSPNLTHDGKKVFGLAEEPRRRRPWRN